MIKKILFVCLLMAYSFLIASISYAKVYTMVNQSPTKDEALMEAQWLNFQGALQEIVKNNSFVGNIQESFRAEMEKDFAAFKKKYIDFSTFTCQDLGENGFFCEVKSGIRLEKIRTFVKHKTNSSRTMGKAKMANLEIVLIDNVLDEVSKDFITYIQSNLNNSGHSLYVLPKGTMVGQKGNRCEAIKAQYEKYKKKGRAYKSAANAAKKRLDECAENKSVQYAFSLEKLVLVLDDTKKTTSNYPIGTLTYRILMLNAQTGRRDHTIKSNVKKAVASDKESLKFKLFDQASQEVSGEITNNILDFIAMKQSKKIKKRKKLYTFANNYTVVLTGVTTDGEDREKLKVVRDVIKQFNAKPKRNSEESTDFEQIYNFGTNDEIDIEDFMYALYDIADSIGEKIRITDNGNDRVTIQYQ